jgi:hypothetical protein
VASGLSDELRTVEGGKRAAALEQSAAVVRIDEAL